MEFKKDFNYSELIFNYKQLMSKLFEGNNGFHFDEKLHPNFTEVFLEFHDMLEHLGSILSNNPSFSNDVPEGMHTHLIQLQEIIVRFNDDPASFYANANLMKYFKGKLQTCRRQLLVFFERHTGFNEIDLSAVNEVEKTRKKVNEIYYEITNSYERLKNDIDKAKQLTEKLGELESVQRKLVSSFNINNDSYKEKISIVDVAYEKVIDFTKNIMMYQKHQDEVEIKISKTIDNAEKLNEKVNHIENNIQVKQKNLDTILRQAEEVLGKASTAALGQFFKEQYEHSQKLLWIWPTMGFLFLSGAIGICVITVFPNLLPENTLLGKVSTINELSFIISRLIVSPLFLVGAWFCASQYVKRKNIIEDYGYKKVLSLSLLSFKAEIEKTGPQNTTEFIRAVQNELIKSPLDSLDRKQHKKETEFLKSVQFEMMTSILNNAKNVLNFNSKAESSKENQSKN